MDLDQAATLHRFELESRSAAKATLRLHGVVQRYFLAYCREQGISRYEDLTLAHGRGFLLWLGSTAATSPRAASGVRSINTINQYGTLLKTWSKWIADELDTDDRLARLKLPRADKGEIPVLYKEDVQALVKAAGENRSPFLAIRDTAILFLFLASGMRKGEMAGLKTTDIDLRSREITVKGKGRRIRAVRFDSETGKVLLRYLSVRPRCDTSALFVTSTGEPLAVNAYTHVVKKVQTKTGIKVWPHLLRHTMATEFAEAHPGELFVLQRLLGHSSLTMTARYADKARMRHVKQDYDANSPVAALGLKAPRLVRVV